MGLLLFTIGTVLFFSKDSVHGTAILARCTDSCRGTKGSDGQQLACLHSCPPVRRLALAHHDRSLLKSCRGEWRQAMPRCGQSASITVTRAPASASLQSHQGWELGTLPLDFSFPQASEGQISSDSRDEISHRSQLIAPRTTRRPPSSGFQKGDAAIRRNRRRSTLFPIPVQTPDQPRNHTKPNGDRWRSPGARRHWPGRNIGSCAQNSQNALAVSQYRHATAGE